MITTSAPETRELAKKFLTDFKAGQIVVLRGDLGSGKTTFVQGLAAGLGVKETVISPTFVVMKIYETTDKTIKHLIHIDGYRLSGEEEIKLRGLDQYLKDPASLVVVEWPERFGELLKADHTVFFSLGEKENERRIELK